MPAAPPTISTLPTPPSTSSTAAFDSAADAFLGALPDFGSDLNAAASNVYANALEAEADATTAAAAAITAANAATTALNAPATQATTSNSITISGGSKSFTLAQTGKAFAVGQWVSVSDTAAPATRWLAGAITAFNSGTGAMTIDVAYIAGSGSGTSWAVHPTPPIVATDASNLSTGTLPDGRFPAVLPAVSGANLTNLDASDLASGTIPSARFPATLPAASAANLTAIPAGQLTGDVAAARLASVFGSSLASAGYQYLPSGLLIQWGSNSLTSNQVLNVTLPLTFPSTFLQAYGSADDSNTANDFRVGAGITSTSQIQLVNGESVTRTVRWLAIGF
jgi:hypothetical protein